LRIYTPALHYGRFFKAVESIMYLLLDSISKRGLIAITLFYNKEIDLIAFQFSETLL